MICAAVFETSEDRRKVLRDRIVRYLIQSGQEMDILWFSESLPREKIEKYGRQIHLAFISLNDRSGAGMGRELYRQNPECRICYYRDQPVKLEPLLISRPIAFYLWEDGQDVFRDKLNLLVNEVGTANDIFCHETRKDVYLIPYAHIMYFQSNLKYVLIHTDRKEDEDGRIFAKLSQIEEKLDGRFVRIHKSYVVNRAFVK